METCLTVKNLQHHSWALMVQEQSNSGLSIRDWCSQNNISTKTFYYRRKLVCKRQALFYIVGMGHLYYAINNL